MHIFGKYTILVGIVRPSMQGSRAPSFIAGNELIGCMCPRRCLGAGYGPNRSMIFGSLRSMALQKSRKVRSMALQKSEESLDREMGQHTQTAELCGSNFESKVLDLFRRNRAD